MVTAGAAPLPDDSGNQRLVDRVDIDAEKPRLELLEGHRVAGHGRGPDLTDDVLAPGRDRVFPKLSGVAVVARRYGLSAIRFDPSERSFCIVCS